MNDLYTNIAHSNFGQNLFKALNLPTPPKLKRSPDEVLPHARGRILIAGAKNAKVLKHLLNYLAKQKVSLNTPLWDDEQISLFASHNTQAHIDTFGLSTSSNHKFKGLIFDATGIKKIAELKAVYSFFHQALNHLKTGGHVIIIGLEVQKELGAEQYACLQALEGFTKSLAKEVGAKGANANLIRVQPGSERQLDATLAFFLSRKSSYVTGQSVSLEKSRLASKISWHKPLAGKTALVTGAAFGIGEETARILARDGAAVVCLDIPANQAKLNQLASSLGGHALCIDLSEKDAAEQVLVAVTSQLGVVDIVIHNAGITRDKTLRKMPDNFWEQVLDINLDKITQINEVLLNAKAIASKGRIVGVSSISGIAGNFGQTNYAASKAGLAGYTAALAATLENGITINAVAPGFIETRMTNKVPFMTREIGRRTNSFSQGGLPLDVAEVISFFCHPGAQALNGNVLRVCGQSLLGR
jgi:3-oxoacyl-[acyl-carrier protein] reductase